MKLVEIDGVAKILEDDIESPPVDFFSPEEEKKITEYAVEKFFSDHKESRGALWVSAKFREKLKEGIEVDCVHTINTYKDLKTVSGDNGKSVSGKMGRFAFFREPLKNKKLNDIANVFIRMVEANLEFYNKTCVDGFQLTMDDVIEHLKRNNIKK